MQVSRISVLWLLAGLAYVSWVQAQNCLPGIKWTNCPRRARKFLHQSGIILKLSLLYNINITALGRCDACLRINFKNAGRDRDIMCMKEKGEGSCIFTGNLLGDSSFFAVTATNPGKCRPFSKDPLEVLLLMADI